MSFKRNNTETLVLDPLAEPPIFGDGTWRSTRDKIIDIIRRPEYETRLSQLLRDVSYWRENAERYNTEVATVLTLRLAAFSVITDLQKQSEKKIVGDKIFEKVAEKLRLMAEAEKQVEGRWQ